MNTDHRKTRHNLCSNTDSPAYSGRMRDPVQALPLICMTGSAGRKSQSICREAAAEKRTFRHISGEAAAESRMLRDISGNPGTAGNGSLSLEAAVCVPIFLLFCIAVIGFLQILCLQVSIQSRMAETARSIDKKAYIIERIAENDGTLPDVSTAELDTDTLSLASAGINPLTIKVWLLSSGPFRNTLDQSRIIGGSAGLYTFASSYDSEDGILDIAVCYDYSIPWITAPYGTLRFVQRMRSCAWIGKSLEDSGNGVDGKEHQTVYVTPSGTVYHLSASCSYLDLSIHAASYAELSWLRNAGGSRYERCEECAAKGIYDRVFITDYGTRWHSSLDCSGLKRTVIEKDISEVEGMRLCTKCRNGEHGSHSH